jgi:hypothetical protein
MTSLLRGPHIKHSRLVVYAPQPSNGGIVTPQLLLWENVLQYCDVHAVGNMADVHAAAAR